MKTQSFTYAPACQCPNQHLLVAGQVCDLCMCIVPVHHDAIQMDEQDQTSRFDQRYFEELEMRYDDMEHAA